MTRSTVARSGSLGALGAWTRAAKRALAADLPHQLRRRGDVVLVPSKSQDGVTYHVRVAGGRVGPCDCPAGLQGRPCAHRAGVVLRLWERETGLRVTGLRALDAGQLARYLGAA